MLPNALSTTTKNNKTPTANNINRRYSLFSVSTASPLINIFGGNDSGSNNRGSKKCVGEKNIDSQMKSSTVCQRCKYFETDLTSTSYELGATDAELKASRQVISLLQRQLELLRVDKESLEKLIISQSSINPVQPELASSGIVIQNNQQRAGASNFSKRLTGGDCDSHDNLDEAQKVLLKMIQTQLYTKDEEIVKLKFQLKETQNDKEQLLLQLNLIKEDDAKLKTENLLLTENLALRDQTIVSLSNEVFEQSNLVEFNLGNRRQSNAKIIDSQQQPLPKTQKHLAKIIDTLDAYKKTNELLSINVMKLTDRCTEAEKKEIETRSQCQELEAKCCQIQSKLLSLLKEIEQSSKQPCATKDSEKSTNHNQEVICSESVKLLIKRLLEDKSLDIPLSWKEGNKSNNRHNEDNKSLSSKYECDELGFYKIADEEQEKSINNNSSPRNSNFPKWQSLTESSSSSASLSPIVEAIEVDEEYFIENHDKIKQNISRHFSVDATKSDEIRWHLKWDHFIKDFDKIDLRKSKEFKILLRSGVPQEYRCKVWKTLIDLRIGKERQHYGLDYYQSLLEPNRPQSSSRKSLNPSSKQIELDLLRTLPNNKHFETLDSSGTIRLRRVLTAYSEHNQKVGYCQGMNRLAAVALLVLPEEEAFWCLSTIIDNIMPTGYYVDLWMAQVDSSVVMDFVAIKMPRLSDHFKQNGVDLSLFAWFLTIFVDGTPPALFLRLWDSFLFEGDKILFRVSIALLKMYESQLLRLNNSVTINNFLRSTVNAPMNIDKFFDVAFDWINPLSTRSLQAKRQQNFQLMKSNFGTTSRSFMTPSPTNSIEDRDLGSKNDDSPYEDSSIISI